MKKPPIGRPTIQRRAAAAAAAALTTGILALGPAGTAAGEGLRQRAVAGPAPAVLLRAQQRWAEVANTFDRLGRAPDPRHAAADAASALSWRVWLEGWHGPHVPALVSALIGTAHPDGGYGLSQPWDAFQDGTVNPPSTSYASTTAGHVGPVLLAGYQAGAVPESAVRRAIDWVLDLPRSHEGRCIPYSGTLADRGKPCVWNVHFGAADWVLRASRATGYRLDDAGRLAQVAVSWLGVARADPATGYWPYSSAGGAPQDLGHQWWTASAVDNLTGTHDALSLMIRRPLWRVQARAVHDAAVAATMAGIARFDCRYATDPTVLAYALSTAGGTPYLFKALAVQDRIVLHGCFTPVRATTTGPG